MSGQMYAGYLCATQVGGKINVEGAPITDQDPWLLSVIHGGKPPGRASARRHEAVRVVLRHVDKLTSVADIPNDSVVTVEDPV